IFAENGEDWKEQLEQIAKEQAFIQALSKKYGVPVERIAASMKAPSSAPAPAPTPDEEQPGQPVPVKQAKPNGHFNGNGHLRFAIKKRIPTPPRKTGSRSAPAATPTNPPKSSSMGASAPVGGTIPAPAPMNFATRSIPFPREERSTSTL